MVRKKLTQEQKEDKAFETLYMTMLTMMNQAMVNKAVITKLKVANDFLTRMIELLEEKNK